MFKLTKDETILPNDYPVYTHFIYIVDNIFKRSSIKSTVRGLKQWFNAKEIRKCDLFAHKGAKINDRVE